MKRIILLAVLTASLLGGGCKAFRTLTDQKKPASQGKPYELIVVCNQRLWDGELGDTLRSVLRTPVPYLSQAEPHFDLYRVSEQGFTRMVVQHRNILKVVVDPAAQKSAVAVQYDLEAAPQAVLTLQGPSEKALTAYVSANRDNLIYLLEKTERDRTVDYARRFGATQLEELIRQKFGVEMHIPQGYTLRSEGDDFLWISYEYPTASQGFFLYQFPYAGAASLSPGALLDARNRFAARIPGPSDGSYMTTSEAYEPDYRMFRLEGRLWAELRGFWDVYGDFMGGPFVSYSTVDTAAGKVFTFDAYVYSPKLGKRNFMHGVEHLLYTIRFSEDADKTQEPVSVPAQ